jgi:hypothetical protein
LSNQRTKLNRSKERFMMEDRDDRLQVMLSRDELRALDDWRFAKRMPSRAAAIRELLRRGLAAKGFATAETGRKSQEYGVIGMTMPKGNGTLGGGGGAL